MTKEQIAIALYGLFDRLWVKSEGVISKEESRALMEAAQFFQNEANVVAVVEPTPRAADTPYTRGAFNTARTWLTVLDSEGLIPGKLGLELKQFLANYPAVIFEPGASHVPKCKPDFPFHLCPVCYPGL